MKIILLKNKKGFGMITMIFWVLVFIIVWVLFFAQQLTLWGKEAVINGGLTGIEAFLYSNINLIIAFILLIFIVGMSFMGRER